jgi:hypothetical protein
MVVELAWLLQHLSAALSRWQAQQLGDEFLRGVEPQDRALPLMLA